ncbi:UDP-4-amino-4,6-dideoxy-N-acetyl-beta-L-altrosamine transaminase [Burkholderiales bacterium]|nr:UDP-4-amino-4,6-dideoxy-N-acetyl-beta-L-altrosamine transaminase [Burkholderiales bacterium]
MIPYGKQQITSDDIDAVVEVLKSDWLTQGPTIGKFENSVKRLCSAKYAVATNSATSALHVACLALGLTNDDWIWTSPNTFVASANCGLYCGAQVDFVDIDADTLNMSVDALSRKLLIAEKKKRLPKIVIPVHFAGASCDMEEIHQLSKKYGFHVIEDASHALGATYRGYPVGACKFSDITVFSFHPVKLVTTGEGGVATTNDFDLAKKMEQFRSHGITREPSDMDGMRHGSWHYQQVSLGYNYRMTDIAAGLGVSQLLRLNSYNSKRLELAKNYDRMFADHKKIKRPFCKFPNNSAWHLYVIHVPAGRRSDVFESMRKFGVGVNVHYHPVHLQPVYKKFGFGKGDFPFAEEHYDTAITLPLFPLLTETDQSKIVTLLIDLVEKSSTSGSL